MKLSKLILIFFFSITNLVYCCPFKFTNDGNLDVLLVEHATSPEKKYYVKALETIEIPGAAPQTYVWVYVQDKVGANSFTIKYGIMEFACIAEGDPLPHLIYSEFGKIPIIPELQNFFAIEPFDQIVEMNPEEFENLPRKRIEQGVIPSLSKFYVAWLAKQIKEGKLSMKELESKATEEIIEQVQKYLASK